MCLLSLVMNCIYIFTCGTDKRRQEMRCVCNQINQTGSWAYYLYNRLICSSNRHEVCNRQQQIHYQYGLSSSQPKFLPLKNPSNSKSSRKKIRIQNASGLVWFHSRIDSDKNNNNKWNNYSIYSIVPRVVPVIALLSMWVIDFSRL